jgi:MoxR-like ATPase
MNDQRAALTPAAGALYRRLIEALGQVVLGNRQTLRLLLAAYATHGHVLLEDVPGTGKTTLAKSLAVSLGVSFNRIQCTPDLLPADILGVSIFNPRHGGFEPHKGPVFTEILLADELNRASPRTQSALLEAMAERQVTLDTSTHPLAADFFVIATQNPVEFHGTYPLPEAQLDRFALTLALGYLPTTEEVELVMTERQRVHAAHGQTITAGERAALFAAVAAVPCARELAEYAVRLVTATRTHADIELGASPRASLTLVRCARALAAFDDLAHVLPEHLQELAVPVLAHRLVPRVDAAQRGHNARRIVQEILAETAVPG